MRMRIGCQASPWRTARLSAASVDAADPDRWVRAAAAGRGARVDVLERHEVPLEARDVLRPRVLSAAR